MKNINLDTETLRLPYQCLLKALVANFLRWRKSSKISIDVLKTESFVPTCKVNTSCLFFMIKIILFSYHYRIVDAFVVCRHVTVFVVCNFLLVLVKLTGIRTQSS